MAWVRERTMLTERPLLVTEVRVNFCGQRVPRGQHDGSLWQYSRLSRPELLLFLSSSSSIVLTRLSGPRSRPTTSQKIWQRRKLNPDLWICSLQRWILDHRGGHNSCPIIQAHDVIFLSPSDPGLLLYWHFVQATIPKLGQTVTLRQNKTFLSQNALHLVRTRVCVCVCVCVRESKLFAIHFSTTEHSALSVCSEKLAGQGGRKAARLVRSKLLMVFVDHNHLLLFGLRSTEIRGVVCNLWAADPSMQTMTL
jgi:hypothetical protein